MDRLINLGSTEITLELPSLIVAGEIFGNKSLRKTLISENILMVLRFFVKISLSSFWSFSILAVLLSFALIWLLASYSFFFSSFLFSWASLSSLLISFKFCINSFVSERQNNVCGFNGVKDINKFYSFPIYEEILITTHL